MRAVLARRHVAHVGAPAGRVDASLEALALVVALPQRKRTFLALKIAGFSHDEISSELGVRSLTVNRQLARARAALRDTRDRDPSAWLKRSSRA